MTGCIISCPFLLFVLSLLQKENLHIILMFVSPWFSLTEFTFDWGMLQPSNLLCICQLVEQEISVEENPASVLTGSRENEANYCREADRESKPDSLGSSTFHSGTFSWLWQPCCLIVNLLHQRSRELWIQQPTLGFVLYFHAYKPAEIICIYFFFENYCDW